VCTNEQIRQGRRHIHGGIMDTNTLLIIILIVVLLGGGGFFFRGRR
jgi:LPXTG-motif cell wall-anchored protein